MDIMPGILQLRLLGMITRRRMNYVPKRRRIYQDPFDVYTVHVKTVQT